MEIVVMGIFIFLLFVARWLGYKKGEEAGRILAMEITGEICDATASLISDMAESFHADEDKLWELFNSYLPERLVLKRKEDD